MDWGPQHAQDLHSQATPDLESQPTSSFASSSALDEHWNTETEDNILTSNKLPAANNVPVLGLGPQQFDQPIIETFDEWGLQSQEPVPRYAECLSPPAPHGFQATAWPWTQAPRFPIPDPRLMAQNFGQPFRMEPAHNIYSEPRLQNQLMVTHFPQQPSCPGTSKNNIALSRDL
jgi:hypothetical protein